MKMDFFSSILFIISRSFDSEDLRIRIQTSLSSDSGPVPKKWILQLSIRHKYNDEGTFCAYIADTFRFIQWRSLSDSASKCFISTSVFSEMGMQKNLSVVNRCGILFQSAALVDFAVFVLITVLSWNECFKTTSSRSSASLRAATHG